MNRTNNFVKVDDLLQKADDYIGKTVELEGYLIVTLDAEKYTPYLSPSDSINDNKNIYLEQPLAEIRKIIQPMHTLFLSYRGELTRPPYIYNFPLTLTADVAVTAEGVPCLSKVCAVRVFIEHTPMMAKVAGQKRYLYTAQVDYTPHHDSTSDKPAKGKIAAQKVLRLSDDDGESQHLDGDENAYARRLIGQKVTIPGWLKYLHVDVDEGQSNYVLRTFALRASMMSIGLLRGMTSIWWQPCEQYKLVRAYMPLADDTPDYNRRVEITGRIDYINGETPFNGDAIPNLTFTRVDAITIHHEDTLLDVTHDPDEDTPP